MNAGLQTRIRFPLVALGLVRLGWPWSALRPALPMAHGPQAAPTNANASAGPGAEAEAGAGSGAKGREGG